jgi:hypothetical protein
MLKARHIQKFQNGGSIDTVAMKADLKKDVRFFKDKQFTKSGKKRLAAIQEIQINQENGLTYDINEDSGTFSIKDAEGTKVEDTTGRGLEVGQSRLALSKRKKNKKEVSKTIFSAVKNDYLNTDLVPKPEEEVLETVDVIKSGIKKSEDREYNPLYPIGKESFDELTTEQKDGIIERFNRDYVDGDGDGGEEIIEVNIPGRANNKSTSGTSNSTSSVSNSTEKSAFDNLTSDQQQALGNTFVQTLGVEYADIAIRTPEFIALYDGAWDPISKTYSPSENLVQQINSKITASPDEYGKSSTLNKFVINNSSGEVEVESRDASRPNAVGSDYGLEEATVIDFATGTIVDTVKNYDGESDITSFLLSKIEIGEGTTEEKAAKKGYATGYDVTLGYGAYDPKGFDKPVSQMTLGELSKFQAGMLANPENTFNSSAVGKYQIVGTTLESLKAKLGLDDSTIFSPEVQDMMAKELLNRRGLQKFINNPKDNADALLNSLSFEWASLPNAKGKGAYDNIVKNFRDGGRLVPKFFLGGDPVITALAPTLKSRLTDLLKKIDTATSDKLRNEAGAEGKDVMTYLLDNPGKARRLENRESRQDKRQEKRGLFREETGDVEEEKSDDKSDNPGGKSKLGSLLDNLQGNDFVQAYLAKKAYDTPVEIVKSPERKYTAIGTNNVRAARNISPEIINSLTNQISSAYGTQESSDPVMNLVRGLASNNEKVVALDKLAGRQADQFNKEELRIDTQRAANTQIESTNRANQEAVRFANEAAKYKDDSYKLSLEQQREKEKLANIGTLSTNIQSRINTNNAADQKYKAAEAGMVKKAAYEKAYNDYYDSKDRYMRLNMERSNTDAIKQAMEDYQGLENYDPVKLTEYQTMYDNGLAKNAQIDALGEELIFKQEQYEEASSAMDTPYSDYSGNSGFFSNLLKPRLKPRD